MKNIQESIAWAMQNTHFVLTLIVVSFFVVMHFATKQKKDKLP